MPSRRRESIQFSNTSRCYALNTKRRKYFPKNDNKHDRPPDAWMRPPTPRPRHRRLVSIEPHVWVSSWIDPHWTYLVTTITADKVIHRHIARYSDLARLHGESNATHAPFPDKHILPLWGKRFDTLEDTRKRAQEMHNSLKSLFASTNANRHAIDDGSILEEILGPVVRVSKANMTA